MAARGVAGIGVVALLLAACSTRPPAPPPAPAPLPAPPTESAAPLSPIHRDLSPLEQLWHVRAGLNVAALSCSGYVGTAIITDYNSLLSGKRALLAQAFAATEARYGAPRAMDAAMTRLYNHFASPAAQPAFCRAAAEEARRAVALDPQALAADAGPMLARLDRPFAAPMALMAARAAPMQVPATAPSAGVPEGWRIQLGAYGSAAAASRAFALLSSRSGALAGRTPHYEAVPGKPLVRLQMTGVESRAAAIGLCAQAAAVGFDCIPVKD